MAAASRVAAAIQGSQAKRLVSFDSAADASSWKYSDYQSAYALKSVGCMRKGHARKIHRTILVVSIFG